MDKIMNYKTERYLLICIYTVCLSYFVLSVLYKPIICNDALSGVLSLHNYLNGGGYNKLLTIPDGKLVTYNLTWWTPAQYQIPYLLSKLCFNNLGLAISVLMFACVCGGSFFYHKLIRLAGLDNRLALAAILILILQRFINIYFIQYNSADLLLFFFTPFYAFSYHYLLKKYPGALFLNLILLTLINLTGVYIKNSFILFEVAWNVFLITGVLNLRPDKPARAFIINALKKTWVLLPFILANIFNYYFFLRSADTPAQGRGLLLSFPNTVTGIFAPVTEILFASVSIYGIYGNFYDKIHLHEVVIIAFMLLVLLAIAWFLFIKRRSIAARFKQDIYFRSVLIISVVYIIIWLFFRLIQSAISNEDRLYLPVTMLIFPYLLQYAARCRPLLKYSYFAVIAISIVYGIVSFPLRINKYAVNGTVFSKDNKLNGFKVLSRNNDNEPDLANISAIITSRFPDAFVIISNIDIAFELSVKNQFIKNYISAVPPQSNTRQTFNYLVLVQLKKEKPPFGLLKIYSSEKFALYGPAPRQTNY